MTLALGLKLKSLQLTLSKDANALKIEKTSFDEITTLCHFSANELSLGLTQYANESMSVEFRLGDLKLEDRRDQSVDGINKIIRG